MSIDSIINSELTVQLDPEIKVDQMLYRYMNLDKFKYFLEKGLPFTRVDKYVEEDPFEGEFTEHIYKVTNAVLLGNDRNSMESLSDTLREDLSFIRKSAFVSCWTFADNENIALWKLYGGPDNSVAIKATAGKIQTEIEEHIKNPALEEVNRLLFMKKTITKIQYIDHRLDDIIEEICNGNLSEILKFKNKGYGYEDEVRAMFWDENYFATRINPGEMYSNIPISPMNLIEEITVSPFSCDCFFKKIITIAERFNMSDRVKWSSLKHPPSTSFTRHP